MKTVAFTIVLNGMPFIETQAKIIPNIFDHWYIIEGTCLNTNCTSWCNQIKDKHHYHNLSNDGTTNFVNSLKNKSNISIIRKNDNTPWNGKLEMCNSFMEEIENCILMQFDVDEIWDKNILKEVLDFSKSNDDFNTMQFKCNYYVGKNLKITTQNTYGDMSYEWFRLWKIKEKTKWVSHEPPKIMGCNKVKDKKFTQSKGWIFDHFAYVNESQVKFKEDFYGYKNALNKWKELQENTNLPCKLKNFLPWINDESIVDKVL